jgi:CheY-like chemotaxis protein
MAAIGELAAGIAHNINNHLAPILANAEMLQASPRIPREQAEMLEDIMGATRQASDLIEQLLAFARKGRFKSGPVDMHQVIREAVGLPRLATGAPVDVTLDLRAEASDLAGDPSQLQNALLNLILNACDAMPQGGELAISTDCVDLDEEACRHRPYEVKPGRYLRICVADTGVGMSEETKARIFQPFFTTKKPGKGTGLGLASVYGCVKSHGGIIEVDSTAGHGTTFDLFFPMEPSAEAAPASAGPGRILCLDNETPLLHLTAKVLERLGYSVTSVSAAEEAIEHYRRHRKDVDLVVLDFEMHGASGLEVLHRLKAINPEVRVLVTALNGGDRVASEAFSEGAIGVLSMPLEIQRLAETVARYVRPATGTGEREAEPACAGKASAARPGRSAAREDPPSVGPTRSKETGPMTLASTAAV